MKQIELSKKTCLDGAYKEPLYTIPNEEFTTNCFEWSNFYEDLISTCMRGKRVKESKTGLVTFHVIIVREENLDMNFHCL
jgi:hypothetical protein